MSFESLVPLQSGKPSKKYKVLSHLGDGSYGKVYKAMNLKTENLVAIKSVKKKKDKEDEDKIVSNEIDLLKRLSHPNIVKIYEFYDTTNRLSQRNLCRRILSTACIFPRVFSIRRFSA